MSGCVVVRGLTRMLPESIASFAMFGIAPASTPSGPRCSGISIVSFSRNTWSTAAGGVGVFLAGFLKRDFGLNAVFASSAALFALAGVMLIAGYHTTWPRDIARARDYDSAH